MPFQKQTGYFHPKMLSKWLWIGGFLEFFLFFVKGNPLLWACCFLLCLCIFSPPWRKNFPRGGIFAIVLVCGPCGVAANRFYAEC